MLPIGSRGRGAGWKIENYLLLPFSFLLNSWTPGLLNS
jgi:hypothetical protein